MKRIKPFLKSAREAHDAITEVFCNTNVSREAVRRELDSMRDMINSYIERLDDDEAAGVQDASLHDKD